MTRRRVTVYVGTGSPEGVVDGVVHDLYFRKDGSGSTSRYVKESGGAGPTGWVANGDSGGAGTPASTVTSETSYGVSSAVGTSTNYAREDHTHGTPSLGTTGATACAGNDARLSDARTPTTHAVSHKSGGGDSIALNEFADPTGSVQFAQQQALQLRIANYTGSDPASPAVGEIWFRTDL